jgi:hypothetical protein
MAKSVALVVFMYAVPALASPGRLGGFSYARDDLGRIKQKPATEDFNNIQPPPMPERPHYLNEDGTDARTGIKPGEDRHKLPQVYSAQQLYDMKSGRNQ